MVLCMCIDKKKAVYSLPPISPGAGVQQEITTMQDWDWGWKDYQLPENDCWSGKCNPECLEDTWVINKTYYWLQEINTVMETSYLEALHMQAATLGQNHYSTKSNSCMWLDIHIYPDESHGRSVSPFSGTDCDGLFMCPQSMRRWRLLSWCNGCVGSE